MALTVLILSNDNSMYLLGLLYKALAIPAMGLKILVLFVFPTIYLSEIDPTLVYTIKGVDVAPI